MTTNSQISAALPLGGVSPNTIRELSGIYPTFVSALKELVSNAYDADATVVKVRFSPDLSTVVVEDNGLGMTPTEFQNVYLRIGGSTQHRGDSTVGGRQPNAVGDVLGEVRLAEGVNLEFFADAVRNGFAEEEQND